MIVTGLVVDNLLIADLEDVPNFSSIPSSHDPRQITFDYLEKKLYWIDRDESIYRSDLDGGNIQQVTSIHSPKDLRGIAVAEISRTLYVAKKDQKKISWVSIEQGGPPFPRNLADFDITLSNQPLRLEVDEEQG
nr:uncharacterized protein LOC129265312 [Lytechinus pictus]